MGNDAADDALVWRRPDGRALIATVDFFTPIVDDARTWGRIAAANALSDVYAMGGEPLFALNLAAWPRDTLPWELLGEVLEGGAEVAEEAHCVIGGGHTVDAPEPMYGLSVTGEADPERLLTNSGGKAGQALLLTKPIGTGIISTMVKRTDPTMVAEGGRHHEAYAAAVASMTRLNDAAARVALLGGASAATDVTGFGLLGHLHELARASGLAADVDVEAVPLLPQVRDLVGQGYVPGGTKRNEADTDPFVSIDRDAYAKANATMRTILADAQTSGGLLIAMDARHADDALAGLDASGHDAAIIGELTTGDPGTIRLR